MTTLRKNACPFITSPVERLPRFRIGAVGGQRAGHRRADEFGALLRDGCQKRREQRLVRVVLEIGVGDGAQAIVLLIERGAHHVVGAWIVEAGEYNERAEANVAVLV